MNKLHKAGERSCPHFLQGGSYTLWMYSVVICSVMVLLTADAVAQSNTISLKVKDVSLLTVMETIEKQTSYRFSYDLGLEPTLKERKVTITVDQETIEDLLPALFRSTGIVYKIVDGNILLSKKRPEQGAVANPGTLLQTIKGRVIDKESKAPLIGVSIVLVNGQSPMGTLTDTTGTFSLKVPVGRQSLKVSYLGYEEYVASDLPVISGKGTFLNIEMREAVVNMREVVIRADQQKDQPINSMAVVSARQLTSEDASRYAGGFYDPARMVSAFAGVMAADDGRNDIVIRGNSPMGLLWKLEGIEIPNPNHFSNGQGDAGGIFSILSSDALTNSDFFTGAFPAEYGNATAGILDLNLRKGNPDKHEYGILVGMIGSQLSLDGPLGKNKGSSYMLNYRYGNLQLLNKLGLVDFDENQGAPVFQDINLNINLATKRAGTFSLFGIGGISSQHRFASRDSMAWRHNGSLRDDETETHKMGVVGIKHVLTLPNNKTFLKTIVAVMDQYDRLVSGTLDDNYNRTVNDSAYYRYPALRTAFTLNHKVNARHTVRAGFIYSQLFFNMYGKQRYDTIDDVYVDHRGNTGLAEAFAEWKYRMTDDLEINSGIHNTLFLLNHDYSFEPRVGLRWQAGTGSSFSYGFGLHSKVAPISVYFSKVTALDGTVTTPNKDLKMTRAIHHVIGYDWSIRQDLRIKAEVYYQYLYDVPVAAGSTYSLVNNQYVIPDTVLQNSGKGYNKGIELTVEKFYSNNYYFLATGSVFDSKYKAGNGQVYDTYFNSSYQANALAGKDFKVGRTGQNVFSVNFKALFHGGFRYTPYAIGDEGPYRVVSETNSKQTPYYMRLDMGLKYRKNSSGYSWIISLDVQNLTNRENVISYDPMFDRRSGQIFLNAETGLGIIPVLNFKVEF